MILKNILGKILLKNFGDKVIKKDDYYMRMRLTTKINPFLHRWLLKYQDNQFVRKNNLVRAKHPELFDSTGLSQLQAHKNLWRPVKLYGKVNPNWFVMHSRLSGVEDYRYVPENIYFPYIEPIFNDFEFASSIADKNRLNEYVSVENSPKVILRYIRGCFFKSDYSWVSDSQAQKILDENDELIIKPSTDSSGGVGVRLWCRSKDGKLDVADLRSKGLMPLVIQEKVVQHKQSALFNASSVNTCRVMTMRCPWNGEVVLLKSMFRIGGGESICDNMMMGGLCLGVKADGTLSKYAYDYDGQRYEVHPTSGIVFANHKLNLYPKMVDFACEVAKKIPYMNILSFDLIANDSGNIICLEINTAGQGITQLQYDGVPLFHKYTDEVVDYCKKHKQFNVFRHFRTFYW